MLSELELDYDVELVNIGKDYKLKGSQEALQKIESGSTQVIANFKDIIRQSCSTIQFDKLSRDFINDLLEKFFGYQFNNENIFLNYRWRSHESSTKSSALDINIELVGRSVDVNLIASKIKVSFYLMMSLIYGEYSNLFSLGFQACNWQIER